MVMRISENMKFNTIVNNMFKSQDSYNKLSEKIGTLKEINKPSDDPIGMNKVLNLRESRASIEQYTRNIDGSESWLTISESKLSAVGDLLVKAREVAAAQSTATATAETRNSEAGTMQQIMEELLVLANSKHGGKYLFSGTKTQEVPFSSSVTLAAETGVAVAADGNTFDGVAASGGDYTGSANKTYVVKIIDGGAMGAARYQISSEGGKADSWSATSIVPANGEIFLGDGMDMTFTAGSTDLATNDIFYVNAKTPGYYNGNDGELSIGIGEGTSFAYSISGEAAFTNKGGGNVDIFNVLNKLKLALENNEPDVIASCIDDLKASSDQITKNISSCGTRMNRLEIAKNNLIDLDYNLAELISDTEDADMSEIITKLAMKETALQASYATASKIGNLTILDFLR
jgi:flagellar hook-associated protein 3 FlgL